MRQEHQRKRVRLSDAPEADHHVEDDEDEISDEAEGVAENDERRRDADSVELEDEDEDMDTQRATQIIQERNTRIMDNKPADNGILESVTCINFMCHTKLHVAFGPLINFIIGHNGSGKSAVLTAVTLCLGGKATATNRGQSLKSFIKEGEESASLIVKIKNTGYSGYQQELYGDSIVVERNFTRAGSSGFKLKSANGRPISTKKADLEEICDYFALQLDNPMNVLTQDMARQFLSNSSPAEKYKFFVKGVQLEQLDQDYQLLEETIDQIESKLVNRADDIKVLEDRATKTAARLALSDKQDSLRNKVRSYSRQMAWAQVEEQEKLLEAIDGVLQQADRHTQEVEAKALTVDEAFDKADDALKQAQAKTQEIRDSAAPIEEGRAHIKERFDKNKADLLSVQADHRSIRQGLTTVHDRIKKTSTDIELENKRLEDAHGGSHARRVHELEEARRTAADAKMEFERHRQARPQLEGALKNTQGWLDKSRQTLDSKRSEVRQCDETLRSLLRSQGQHVEVFHERMPLLLRAINDERRFRQMPVGPVGNHVRLLKPEWSSILEKSLGGILSSFIVTSINDQNILSELMRRVNCVCPVLIGNNQPIDTSNHEPDPTFDTTLRVLEIDNELVKRQLIIAQAIEQTILIQSWPEANNIMNSGPRNVKQCFCMHQFRRGWGMRLVSRGGESSSAPIQGMTGKPRMKTDSQSQVNIQRDILRDLEQERSELERQVREIQDKFRSCEQALVRHQRQEADLRVQVQRAEDEAEKQQDELERDTVQDGRLEALKEGLKDAEEEKSVLEGSYQEAIIQKEKLNEVAKSLNRELKTFDEEIKDMAAKIKKAEMNASKLAQARHIALQEKNQAIQKIEDAKADKEREERKRQAQVGRVGLWASQAAQICARVPVDPGETPASLDKKLGKLHQDITRFEQQMGATRETIAQEAAQARSAFQTAKAQVKDLEALAQLLKLALLERQDRWRKFQRFISARARAQFTYLLSERSFRGSLKTDHQRHQLDLHVEPDETKTGKGRQTKTLSGGEKSFSTICLLLSLWEAMGSPIRCLDEFDVFMDNVNRDVSLRMMIMAARRSVGRQFILITPQSMGNVDVAGDVKIIKLSDPERGQTTLPFAG
ncbi:MAG: Structural maintenance of chromosomes protein 6 [Peltula sp. TS41687]|nr:MAG: Structural maintenance of chromosomes protein 6 [Peltula sp. TS41687]